MWGFLQDAEVSLGSINRGLMLPMSRESWILKEGAVIGSPMQRDAWERSTGQLGTREPSVSSSRPQSRQSSRPKTASRPSSVGSCRKAKRSAATLSELKESASTRTAAWLRAYAAYEQSLLQGSGAPLGSPAGDPRRSSLQRMQSAPESLELRPSSATHRGPGERRGRAPVTPTATPQQRQPTPAGGKRLRRQCSGAQTQLGDERLPRREERIAGWPAPWADATPSSPLESFGPRPNTTPSRTREKKTNEMGKVTTTGLVRAVECDKKFQAILLEKWRRETDLDTIAERIHRRQVCQFFDFLKNKEGDMNTESAAVAYIEEGFADPEFIEAELSKAAPDLNSGPVPQASQELPAAKKAAIRQVLLLYGQISRPSSQGVQEVLYRSTWCRFILDSNLVAMEAEDTERPSFHKSVRLFDNISKYGKEGGQRYANLDHCVTLVVQLMMQINMPASLAWELFEEGLLKAERTVEAIYGEVQHQVDECVQVLAKEITEEAIMERRIDMFGKHGSPPQSFQGSLLAWTRGLRFWINVTTTSCLPENTVERIEQSLANEQFARDEITEPGCLYTVAKYEGLFEELFLAYCYEERTAVKEDENGKTRNEDVKHMSFAAFFRFCADFHVFPGLVSFEEAWVTYKNADCIVILGTKAQPTKVKQFKKSEVSPSRVSAILGLRTLVNRVRKGKDDPDEDKKTDTSNSEKEEEEQPSSSSSDDESSEGLEGMDSGLGESPVSFHRVRAGTAGDEIRSRQSSNASKSSKTHTVPASIASVGTVNSLQIPGQPNRSRRGVNDSEVKAALAVHRRQSIGPGDQAAIPIIRTLSEKGEQVQPESERSPLNGEGNTSETEKKEVVVASSRQGSKTSARGGSKGSAAGSPPPEQEELEKPTKGSKFLHMLGSLSADKVKDIFAGSPDEPKKKEVVPPRVKTATADFQWMAKPFRDMNDKELKSYSLLIALDECCRDHFLNIRGLVRVGRITESKQGLLSYLGFMELMKKFRITHGFETSSALQEFMRGIDPSSDGMLDPVELEKAVSAVHEDDLRRHPTAEPKGGPFAAKLGEEARKLSALPIEVDGNGKEIPAAFSSAAFTECLLLLGYRHMHGSGVPVKGAAPAAAKAMYLINFLHHQHDCLAKAMAAKKEKAAAEAAEQVAANLVAPRSPPRSPDKGPSPAPSVAPSPKAAGKNSLLPPAKHLPSTLNRMVGAARKVMRDNRAARMGDKRNAVVTAVLDQGAEAESEPGSSRIASKEPGSVSPKGRGAAVAQAKEEMVPVPDSASYTNVSEVFMKNNQDLFKKWLDGDGRLPQLSPWFSESNQMCSKCKRKRDQHGIGNVFCHFCSCVDSKPLNETLLYPVMERARMRRKQKGQKEAPAAPIRVAINGRGVDAASQRSGSNN